MKDTKVTFKVKNELSMPIFLSKKEKTNRKTTVHKPPHRKIKTAQSNRNPTKN